MLTNNVAGRGRPRKAAEEALQPITVLVPPALKQSLEAEAKRDGRSFSAVVRRRLEAAPESNTKLMG